MPIIDILLHHVLGMTVALLDIAFELLALAIYRCKVVVSELGPFFLDLADELLPVTFDTIPIHETLLLVGLLVVAGGTVSSGRTELIDQRRFRPPSSESTTRTINTRPGTTPSSAPPYRLCL